MLSLHPRLIVAVSAAAAAAAVALGGTSAAPVDTAVATTVVMPECDPSYAKPPADDRQAIYQQMNATGSVAVTAPRHKAVEVRSCLVTGDPAKLRVVMHAFKAPKSARYFVATTQWSTLYRDGTASEAAADVAVPQTEREFDRLLRKIKHRVELRVPGIGDKVYVSRRDVLTTIAKRQNGKRITDDERSAAAKAFLASLPDRAPQK